MAPPSHVQQPMATGSGGAQRGGMTSATHAPNRIEISPMPYRVWEGEGRSPMQGDTKMRSHWQVDSKHGCLKYASQLPGRLITRDSPRSWTFGSSPTVRFFVHILLDLFTRITLDTGKTLSIRSFPSFFTQSQHIDPRF